ncbi:Na/Pi cotransporter family protein [Rhizobium sp. FKL33]|uniref:Na/Pi cotransporter family protein n=1 Tax=Rhizobium sp. FKL33 TaxID=2562307 RepID=UPI0010C119DB|nr:Na/Pi cotransporter family protein [Rhizobium sp. FKL33]
MSGSVIFINLAGAVALLLWATRMVRTGVERAYGDMLKEKMRYALGNRVNAAAAGFFLAIALQSSTAVALIVSGFSASGFVSSTVGISALLGADLGSAFVTRILRRDLSLLVPLLMIAGTIAYRTTSRRWREMGRILFGLGLLLLSLRLIGEASAPLKESHVLPIIMGYLQQDWITAFALAALMAWLFHSSVASILLFASLSSHGLVPNELIIPFVLGVNFGGAVIGAVLTRGEVKAARIAPLGNVAIRGLGMVAGLILQLSFQLQPEIYFDTPADAVVWMHVIANAVVLLIGLPFAGSLAQMLENALPSDAKDEDNSDAALLSALDPSDIANPPRALDNATREVVGMCDRIEVMLTRVFDAFLRPDEQQMTQIERLDDSVDRFNRNIKLYLAKISGNELAEDAARRQQDLLEATINLEQVGDIISQNMLAKARKKDARGASFSEEGLHELTAMHQRVLRNARLAFNLLVNRDLEHARQLVKEKEVVRDMVRVSEENHIKRLGENRASIDSSSIHIDTMRDLKEINSLLVSIAYPVLAQAGQLRTSRLL